MESERQPASGMESASVFFAHSVSRELAPMLAAVVVNYGPAPGVLSLGSRIPSGKSAGSQTDKELLR